jgi:predicted amidohydrolase
MCHVVSAAKVHGCELVIFPEMTLTGFLPFDMKNIAEPKQETLTLQHFGTLAKNAGLSIVYGACLIEDGRSLPSNQLCVARLDGSKKAIYSKGHPFSFAREDKISHSGKLIITHKVGRLEFGASICCDLRFPELYSTI